MITAIENLGLGNGVDLKYKVQHDTGPSTITTGSITADGLSINPFVSALFTVAFGETATVFLTEIFGIGEGGSYSVKAYAGPEKLIPEVPIPAAGLLFGSALAGIGFLSRRRRRKTTI